MAKIVILNKNMIKTKKTLMVMTGNNNPPHPKIRGIIVFREWNYNP